MADELAAVQPLLDEYADVEKQLSDPSVHDDQARARKLGRRYAELGKIVQAVTRYREAEGEVATARELAEMDASFAAELPDLEAERDSAHQALLKVLSPRDPDDVRDVIMEIKAGEGGDESALFAGDLLRMYTRYAETKGWSTQILSSTPSDLGGIKDAQIAFKAKGNPSPEEGVWAQLKFEGGVHRVQRVPVTESQGRIHTSAAGVLVMPEADETDDDITLDPNELKIDVFRSSGPGGQSVNTTDSAVRITHIPSGIVVSMQDEKSQLQNKEAALRVLRARLLAEAQAERAAAEADMRHSQVRTVDRSERIRTYNFPENRISDHRTGYKSYNLEQVLNGALGPVIQSCIDMDEAERLASASGQTE